MRVEALAVVRNEADIIEAFVRHNLQFLDQLTIIDNGSEDTTVDILSRLRAEGLPLVVDHDHRTGHVQEQIMSERIRDWRTGTDWLFLLDADEFIEPVDDNEVADVLRRLPTDTCHLLRWEAFVPTPSDGHDPNPVNRITHRVSQGGSHWSAKLLLPGAFLGSERHRVTPGNHWIWDGHGRMARHEECLDLRLGHFPIRSADQLRAKAIIGHWAISSRATRYFLEGQHWAQLHDRVLSGDGISAGDLERVAREYGRQEPIPELTLVDAPLNHRSPVPLRYLPDKVAWKDLAISHAREHFDRLRHTAFESDGATLIAKTRYGPMMYQRDDPIVGRSLTEYGEWAHQEVDLLLSLLGPGDVVVDAGAGIGTVSIPLAGQVEPGGHLVALEPDRLAHQLLCGNLALNNLSGAEALRQAAGVRTGPRGGPVRSLDSLELDRVDLLRIAPGDTADHVLDGAIRTIGGDRPALFIAGIAPEESPPLIYRIHSLGYRCWWQAEQPFNPDNFYHNPVNVFSGTSARPRFNLLCLAAGTDPPSGLEPVPAPPENSHRARWWIRLRR